MATRIKTAITTVTFNFLELSKIKSFKVVDRIKATSTKRSKSIVITLSTPQWRTIIPIPPSCLTLCPRRRRSQWVPIPPAPMVPKGLVVICRVIILAARGTRSNRSTDPIMALTSQVRIKLYDVIVTQHSVAPPGAAYIPTLFYPAAPYPSAYYPPTYAPAAYFPAPGLPQKDI